MNLVRITLNTSMGGTAEYTINTDTWQLVNTGGAVLHDEEFIIDQAQLIFYASSQYQGQEPPIILLKEKTGRPRITAHDWAFEQEENGIPRTDVYPEWKKLYEAERIAKGEKIPRYSILTDIYKSAINYRKRRKVER